MSVLKPEDLKKLTRAELENLASHMYNPVKFCNSRLSAKEKNKIIKAANPKWSALNLGYHLYDETPIITSRNEVKVP